MSKNKNIKNKRSIILFLTIILAMASLSACKKDTIPQEVEATESEILGFIKTVDTKNKTITVDEVEMLYPTDTERLAEIGMKSEDIVTDYYLYNEDETLKTISYDEDIIVALLDEVDLVSSSIEELEEYINERPSFFNIKLKNDLVVIINEYYLP